MIRALILALLTLLDGVGCARTGDRRDAGAAGAPDYDPAEPLLVDLEKDEAAWRASTDWATFPSSDQTLGPDPYDIVALGNGMYVGALRGANAVVLLTADARELHRAPAANGARSLAVAARDRTGIASDVDVAIDVAGDLDARIWRVVARGATFTSGGPTHVVPHAGALRGVARDDQSGTLLAVDVDGDLHSLAKGKKSERELVEQHIGAFTLAPRVAAAREITWVAAASVQRHTVEVARLDARGAWQSKKRTLAVDGPVLGVALRAMANGDALVAFGHVEDHPLDRTIGSFGYIDSFVRVVRISADAALRVRVVADVNVSEHGVITPKALAFMDDGTLVVAGAGSAKAARISWPTELALDLDLDRAENGEPVTAVVKTFSSLPGVVSLVPTQRGFIGASPLLDAWVIVDDKGVRSVPVPVPVPVGAASVERSVDSKLGEALMFTNVMAPRQKSEGALSRFTCEACHFEGIVDGRSHDTGRMGPPTPAVADGGVGVEEHVRATTKPLWGLFNNVPLFTRAMDPNITRMVHAEFAVANSNSSLDPWFALTPADAAWLSLLGVEGTRSPIELRRAMVAFFRDFTPRTNPHVAARLAGLTGTKEFTAEEKEGAQVFRARCVSCHAARLVGDDAKTEQPIERWQQLVMSANGPIVWSTPEHRKTGVEPYVHEDGARASSLRRVWLKTPLFTTGVARSLADVLDLARVDGETFLHQSNRADLTTAKPLPDEEKRALLAFLRLL